MEIHVHIHDGQTQQGTVTDSNPPTPTSNPSKPKRKVSKYQREFGRQLKKLKQAHPKTKIGTLMKRAHSATKKTMRK